MAPRSPEYPFWVFHFVFSIHRRGSGCASRRAALVNTDFEALEKFAHGLRSSLKNLKMFPSKPLRLPAKTCSRISLSASV